ncbi:MAG: N(4)-(beta-N-acetylglucosaminyl)-L-asparaginase [Bacteroidetes bacterium]|jgi:N4-(beta-N-acetylglucosaminyl)-L-asparaginase|nr:N(4)-(beta-N-acetylglucosaminyl)-L-asparaginase [Bacteroidota bacterium]
MTSRRNFIKGSFIVASLAALPAGIKKSMGYPNKDAQNCKKKIQNKPIVISTWNHGLDANEAAWKVLNNKGYALDAVEAGVKISEADPEVSSVGYGGMPDRDGNVTLDACIMDELGNCGSVGFLKEIMHPISVARKVMTDTPHVMLTGIGAQEFALNKGFKKENLLTYEAKLRWQEWMRSQNYHPEPTPDKENHDTIGMLALDEEGKLCGACTTSGLAWKLHGRVGDSPIIGAGLFVDGDVGGAVATGKGEAVIKIAGTHLVVELMRQGKSPEKACQMAVERIMEKQKDYHDFQVGFIALNKYGEYGTYSLTKGFEYAVYTDNENKLVKSPSLLK